MGLKEGSERVLRKETNGLVVRQAEPLNLEGRFADLKGRVTPTEQFYVRSHFPIPEVDVEGFRLIVEGAVEREVRLSLEALMDLPRVTRAATLECAGNGRIFLKPPVAGVQWELGAVGNGEWTGVRLGEVLRLAGVRDEAEEVVLEGADHGVVAHEAGPATEIAYARGVPVDEAQNVVLAYEMNGEPLSREHGFPLRAIVPGHYAMASVKWLTRIHVSTKPFCGYFQTEDYAYWDDAAGQRVRRPIRSMALKSSIARPVAGDVLAAGSEVMVAGAAWSGGSGLDSVEVSTDGGATWGRAEFLDPDEPGVWRRWQFVWRAPGAGEHVLISRATDGRGNVQPTVRDGRMGTYVIHHLVPVPVTVR
jgi:DMSO/TMAO reductase YedYZ molybdopterin-dependent catalytic subunit